MTQSQSGIQLKVKLFAIAIIFLLFPVTLEIDGQARKVKWGSQFVPVSPGQHTLVMYYKYLFIMKCNRVTTEVSVPEGQVLNMTYSMRWLVFLPGKLKVTSAPPAVHAEA